MDKVQRAFTRFMIKSSLTFENHLLVGMEIEETREIPTAATNGFNKMWYNPDFFNSLNTREIMGVMAHEVWHKGEMHCFRQGNRLNHQLWNIAIDFEANAAVMAAGHNEFQLPGDPLGLDQFEHALKVGKLDGNFPNGTHFYDPQMQNIGFITAEQIYDRLEKHAPAPKIIEVFGPGEDGEGKPLDNFHGDMSSSLGDASSGEDQTQGKSDAQLQAEAAIDIMQAAKRAETAGSSSARTELARKAAGQASVDWRRELRKWTTSHFNKDDWSFRRQNRQAITQGLILPTLHSEAAGRIVVAVDTSGSCLGALDQFGAEIKSIFKQIRPKELIVLYADYEVCHVDRFDNYDQISFAPHGGGGTSFRGPFKWLEENKIRDIDCMVYLTDLYGDAPEKPPRFPMLWAVTADSHGEVPWGKAVPVKV